MIDGADPVSAAQISPLIVGDRDEREIAKGCIERRKIGQVQSPVERRQGPIGNVPHQRSVKQVDVEVQHVELVDPAADLVQHDHVVRQRIAYRRIEAQRYVAAADEPGRCLGVAAGKQRDIVSLAHEFFSQKRNDAFRAAIKPGWHAFIKWGNLSDTHPQHHRNDF